MQTIEGSTDRRQAIERPYKAAIQEISFASS